MTFFSMKNFPYFLGILIIFVNGLVHADPIEISSVADWVIDKKISFNQPVPKDEIQQGVHYLLVDKQIRVSPTGSRESFIHYADQVVNQNGISEISQVNINFDPSYQQITLNSLNVWRNGVRIDKSQTARISILQREEELDNLIYNGQNTMNIILDDIRTGDIVEYSFTKTGANPVYNNHFSFNAYLQWSVPVDQVYYRILWEKPTPLYYKIFNSQLTLDQKKTDSGHEYWIEIQKTKSLQISKSAPSWYDPYSNIEFSEFNSWSDVVKWALPMYQSAINSNDTIKTIANEIKQNHENKEDQIAAALQFVQKEVRYLGIELGKNSHQPSKAVETLNRRYGDCKDKAVLLLSLLTELQLEAYPAKVNTFSKQEVINSLPSVNSFNHVIVQLTYNNQDYWLDPTRHGYALVIKPSTTELTAIQPSQVTSIYSVKDSFDLTAENRNNVTFSSESEYYGLNAENQRDTIANNSLTQTQSDYLNFYKFYYPSIKTIEAVTFKDDPENNKLTASEKYSIEDFWKKDNTEKRFTADFYSNAVNSYLKEPKNLSLKDPLKISYPVNIRQAIKINLKGGNWSFDKENLIEDNPFFYLSAKAEYNSAKKQLSLNYHYRSKTSYVPADQLENYIASLKKTDAILDYSIYENFKPEQTSSSEIDTAPSENWPMIILVSYISATLIALILWLLESRTKTSTEEFKYYPVAIPKLAAMWFFTFGLYAIYWFYKNWLFIKNRDNSSLMPIARGIFNIFWYYPLYTDLLADNKSNHEKKHLPGKFIAGIAAIIFFLANFYAHKGYFTIVILTITFVTILPLANYINYINNKNSAYKHNSSWSFRHYLISILAIPILILTFGSEIGLTANEDVVAGNRVLAHNIKFMQRKGILNPDDHLIYFYSGAIFNIQNDGNGLTDRHVFSYWKDENDIFNYETANFDEIKEIKTYWSNSWDEDSTIDIIRKDDSKFMLYLSNGNKMDKVFVAALKKRWKNLKN